MATIIRRYTSLAALLVILMICIGIIIAWVQQARSNAVVQECRSRMRVAFGIGLLSYEAQYDRFPPAGVPNSSSDPDSRLSWLVDAWPFVGDGQVRLDCDKALPWNAATNIGLARTVEANFICPAGSIAETSDGYAVTHYVGISGIGPRSPSAGKQDPCVGVFGYDRLISRRDMNQGPSNTILVIETQRIDGPWTAAGRPTMRWADESSDPPVGTNGSFGGLHPFGASTCFGDGSVRMVGTGISPEVFRALCALRDKNGGDLGATLD